MVDYNVYLIPKAKALRKNATPQEQALWFKFLKDYPIKFRRQKPLEKYIVDFYCHKAKLAIEIDGAQHFEDAEKEYDAKRTEIIERRGIKVIRFTNLDINVNFNEVCEMIDNEVKNRISE